MASVLLINSLGDPCATILQFDKYYNRNTGFFGMFGNTGQKKNNESTKPKYSYIYKGVPGGWYV